MPWRLDSVALPALAIEGIEALVTRDSARLVARIARMVEQAQEQASGPSIEDAEVIVAGGRGLGAPEGFKLAEEQSSDSIPPAADIASEQPYQAADEPSEEELAAIAEREIGGDR